MPTTLASILQPLNPVDFRSNYYEKKAIHIGKCPDKFLNLFNWDSLNRVLNFSPLPHPTMKIVLDGKPLALENENIDAVDIIERCRQGATLIIEHIDKYDDKIGELATALSYEINETVQINLYFSQPNQQGFKVHYDTHDVFILQILGFKGWRVFDSTIKFPLFIQKTHGLIPPETPYLESILEPGDVLYIPKGHWHEAMAQVEPSVHLTLGIYTRTGISFLSWLVDELRNDVRWRESFPLIYQEEFSPNHELPPGSINYFEKLKNILIEKVKETSLPYEYHKFCIAQEKRRKSFAFSSKNYNHTVAINQSKKFSRTRYQRVFLESKPDIGFVEVTISRKILRFSLPAEQLLRFIFTSTTFNNKDLLNADPRLTWEDILIVIDTLVKEGLLEIIE